MGTSFTNYQLVRHNVPLRDLSAFAPSITVWPFTSRMSSRLGDFLVIFVAVLVVAVVVAAVVAAIGTLGAAAGRGAVSVAMTAWFASVVAGAAAGFVGMRLQQHLLYDGHQTGLPWSYGLTNGCWWGLVVGWFAAIVGAGAFLLSTRSASVRPATAPQTRRWDG